jgi:hypothetical protein
LRDFDWDFKVACFATFLYITVDGLEIECGFLIKSNQRIKIFGRKYTGVGTLIKGNEKIKKKRNGIEVIER